MLLRCESKVKMSDATKFANKIRKLQKQKPIPGMDYFGITVLGNEDGTICRMVQTSFCGYTETKPQREIRKASFVNPERLIYALTRRNEPPLVVNNQDDFTVYILFGGHGIVESSLAIEFFPDLIDPRETAYSYTKGILNLSDLSSQILQHAPTKKVRMKILVRDGFRCRACGRSPQDYTDVELHVHHICPWAKGGLTEEDNLITLCKTCHDGLDPHFDLSLMSLLGIDPFTERIRNAKSEYIKGLMNYNKIASKALELVARSHA